MPYADDMSIANLSPGDLIEPDTFLATATDLSFKVGERPAIVAPNQVFLLLQTDRGQTVGVILGPSAAQQIGQELIQEAAAALDINEELPRTALHFTRSNSSDELSDSEA